MKTPAHSVSAIKLFRQCPGKYKHEKVLKDVPFKESPALAKGNAAHDAIEAHGKHGTAITEAAVPNAEKVVEIIRKLKAKPGTVDFEASVTIRRDGSLTTWFDRKAWFRFKRDAVWRRADGQSAHILDWKTGSSHWLDDFQTKSYNVAETITNNRVVVTRSDYVCLDEGAEFMGTMFMERPAIEAFKRELYDEALNIEEEVKAGRMPYVKNNFCKNCGVKELGLCEEYK